MKVSDIFDVRYGHNLEEIRCTRTDDQKGVLFVSRSGRNNGVTSRVLAIPERQPGEAGLLTVACGGTVMSTFVQTEPFYTGRDVYILTPKDPTMSLEERLWWAACLRAGQSDPREYRPPRQGSRLGKSRNEECQVRTPLGDDGLLEAHVQGNYEDSEACDDTHRQ